MTQTVYPFDPHGTNGACYIKNEANSLLSSFGTHRCVIPKAAPFYKKDFVAVSGGRTLVEGVDFYFGHQYVRGTHQTAQAIYGSIYILNSAVTTPLTLTYRTLGGQYTTTDVKITTYLANSLTDPTTARWEDVITDLYFPPVDIDYNIDTYRDEKDLASALASVGTAIVAQDPKNSDEYTLYDRWLKEQRKIVDDSLWAEHLANQNSTTPGTGPVTPGPTDNTIVSLNLKQLVYDEVDYDLAAKFMLVTPRGPGFFSHFYSNGITSWSSMSAEAMSQYIWTFADQDTAERVSSIYKDERGFWKQSFLDVRPGTGMVSGYQFTNYHAVWELCAGHMAPLPPYNSPDGQPVLIPGQYGSVELVLVHAPNKDGPMPAILLTITDTWFDDKQGAVITLQSYYREVTIFSQAISGALHYGTKFRVTVDLTDTPDMADGLWLPDALAVVVTAVYPDNHLTEVMNTRLTYADLGGLREHLYSNQGVHTGIAEYNAYNPTTKLIQFTFDTHSSNTTTGGGYVLDGGIINPVGVGFYLGQESNRQSWVWQYSETPNLYDPSYWGEEYMMTGLRGVILNSDFSFLDSNTLFFDSTIPGYTQQYAGVYSEYTYGFFSLTTYVSGGAANVQLIEQIGQFTFDLGGNEPGIAAIVLKDDQVGPAGNQLSVIIDPYNVIGSGSISVWYNFRTNTEVCLGFSDSFYNEPVSWDTLGEIKVVATFLPAGIEVSVYYGVNYAQYKSLTVPMDVVTMVVALDQILLSSIGVGGMMQPRLCFADTVVEEYTYFYQQDTAPVVTEGTNPHNTQWYEAGALKSDGVAQNADMLKNLTIDQLTTQARDTQGIQISKYFPLDAERVLTGDLILADGRAGISRKATDGSKEALIQLSTGNSHVNGDRNVTIIADQKRERVGTSASLKSGANVLKVVSSGPDQEPDQLFFNNQLVLTTETLKDHLPLDVNASVNVVTENTAEMTFSGKGSTLDPLKVTFNYPTGTTALRGLVRLTSALDNSQPAYAGTPAAVKTLNDRLANLIPTTRKVNGMALTGPIVITKSQLSIQYVENLADMNYPVYPQYQVELDKYSVTNHSHNIDDFDINAATSSVAGVVKYAYNVGSGTTTALNSYVYQLLSNRLGGLEASVNTKVPANALKLNKYGAATYLPVPAVATYPAAGPNTISQTIVGEVELDGTLVILRNGSDIIDSGVYYAYMSLDADGAITKYTATTTQYAPSFLPAGVTARAVYRGSEGVFILRDSTDAYWVVLTNNTMEGKYHVGSKLLGSMPYGQQLMPIIVDDSVYFIYTNLSATEYAFKAWKVPKASIGTGTLTVTAQTFTGTDAYGNAQTNVTTYTLVPGGISTDPTAKVLAIDTSGGKWTTRNVRHAELNYDMVADGTSVRVMIYVSSYFANATTSMWKNFTTSFVIDFAAKSASVDLPAGFPLVYSATDLTTTLPKGGVDKGFPFAQANNYAGVIRSAGKRFAYFYSGIEIIPAIRAFKYTYSGTDIQQIKDVNVSSAALGATYSILGNYGSPVHMNCRGYHLIKGNRYIAVNGDGTYVMGEYSPTTRYTAWDAGYGPTTNRTSITQAKFESLKRTLFNASTGQSDGVVLMDDLLTVNSKYDPSTDVQSAPVSISTAEFNALKALFFAKVPTADAGTRFIKSKLSVYVPNDTTLPVLGVYVYRAYTDDTSTTAACKVIIAQLSVGSRTTLSGVALNYVIYTYTFNSTTATDIGDYNPAIAGSCVGKLAGGTVVYTLQTNATVNNVGDISTPGFMMVYTPSNSTWVKIVPYNMVSYYVNGRYITSDRGLFALSAHSSGEGAVMSLLGTTLTEINSGATLGSGIFNSSRVAEGWYVYLTEPMSYVANGIRYTLPTQTMDLRTYFPSAYQNRTLYLFADVQGGTAKYVWSSVKNPDSTTATYIGYCKTGTDRITELALERVTRLGDFKELVDHKNSIVVHGVSNNTQATIGLPLVENRAPAYELDTSVFSEVFNSWKRISHAPADYTQPANPNGPPAWAYSAATDTISCTMNTATYVGFVSPNKIADYEFDTVVGVPATSADEDNDAISIIIGYVEVNGVQRTLSVVRSRSIGAYLKVTTQFGIYYDYQLPDQLSVKTVDTTASETVGSWRGYCSRIHVKRVGNTFTVKATKLDTKTYSSVTDADYIFSMTFTLDDLPELAIFKGPIQYGYGAYSQTDATYINYLRPDTDGRNYYGTTIEAMKALYWQCNAVIQSGIIAHGGVLPIPAGLTRDQCRYYLTIDKLLNGTASSAIQDINLTYDPTTYVVTASFTRADGSTIAGNAAYTVLAAPGFKLFN